jgi:dipeptidyl aminopeptidase/acylaminoacyl peptidase
MGQILFTYNDSMWLVNADGSDAHEFSVTGVLSLDGRFSVIGKEDPDILSSPDAKFFILEIYSAGHLINNITIEMQGGLESTIFDTTWSSDGGQIAFLYQNDVYTIKTDGSNLTRLTNYNKKDFFCSGIYWSPSGSRIAVRCVSNTDPELTGLYITTISSRQTILVPVAYFSFSLAWTPDEEHVFFVGHCNLIENGNISTYDHDSLYIVDSNGQNLQEYWGAETSADLVLSPDGKYIAFSGQDPYDNNGFEILLIHVDELQYSLLPDNTSDLSKYYKLYLWTDNSSNDYHPGWSPDSKHIVYSSELNRSGLFVLSLDTQKERQVLDFGKDPVWLPNP